MKRPALLSILAAGLLSLTASLPAIAQDWDRIQVQSMHLNETVHLVYSRAGGNIGSAKIAGR